MSELTDIAFDIEVAGLEWEEVDEVTRGYLLDRARDDDERAAVPERTALYLGLGKVIAIGMWNLATDQGGLLLEGAPTPALEPYERMPGSKIQRGGEADLLKAFWKWVAPGGAQRKRLISFNGRGYDLPVLAVRSAMFGIKPSRPLDGKPWEMRESHVDLMDVLTFQGSFRERYKLDYWCRRFGVESPKTKLDGSQVARAYRDGAIEDIGEYCLRDTRATAELFRKIRPTLIEP
ncbi:MAG TPA: ribonuclease H-like domain-containing protein [Planctomycetota bacterium]|nr:ribonuclease H-like domain-containing protein [Planctomycetota bacterium]